MFKNIIFGAIIGVANVIPGVSGGTMAVVLGIYDVLISAISNFTKNIKSSLKLLIPIAIGGGAGILLFAKLLSYCLDNHYMLTNFFFVGVILGSIPLIFLKAIGETKESRDTFKLNLGHIISFLATLAIMIYMLFSSNITENTTIITSLTPFSFFYLLLSGAIAAICMIIPGISGSFVLVLLGAYSTIITAVDNLNVLILLPVVIGIILGILLGAKVIEKILVKYSSQAYFAILGFVLGSIPVIINNIYLLDAFKGGIYILLSVIIIVFGTCLSYFSTRSKIK